MQENFFKQYMTAVAKQYGIASWSSLMFEHGARKRRLRESVMSSRGLTPATKPSANAATPQVGMPFQILARLCVVAIPFPCLVRRP